MPPYQVAVDQLRVGVFVRLTGNWMAHPFLFNNFKIKKQEQIDLLRELGIETVLCIPEKSDQLPDAPKSTPPPGTTTSSAPAAPSREAIQAAERAAEKKRQQIERLRERREKTENCEKAFKRSAGFVKNVMSNFTAKPEESIQAAEDLVEDMAASMLAEKDIVVHLMADKDMDASAYFHSLNVSVLAMMLAKEAGLDANAVRVAGMGALFHDIGKTKIPSTVLRKPTALTKAEKAFLEQHPKYGAEMASKVASFPAEALEVIRCHHERIDGAGYPDGLAGDQIPLAARIVSIANVYDNLCNRANAKDSLTPNEAMSRMFKGQKGEFDENLVGLFIRCLGIYPPGTIVALSNDMIGMVIAVDSSNLLKPSVLLYDPTVPKKDALIFDMAEDEDISVTKSIRPAQLPKEVYDYLNPRLHVGYYFEGKGPAKK